MDSEESRIHTSASRTATPVINFFSLPHAARTGIYRRVLVVTHPLYLFQHTGSQRVEIFAPGRPVRWLALLYTNRQADLLQSFLNCVGSVNAGHLSHICVNFPVAESVKGRPEKTMLKEDDLRSLKLLQEKCINLTTLETIVQSHNSMGLTKASQDSGDSQLVREGLLQIDAELRAIPSLRKIIVSFYDGPPTPEVTESMQRLGKIDADIWAAVNPVARTKQLVTEPRRPQAGDFKLAVTSEASLSTVKLKRFKLASENWRDDSAIYESQKTKLTKAKEVVFGSVDLKLSRYLNQHDGLIKWIDILATVIAAERTTDLENLSVEY
ncbi:hypothetical protein TOPH_02747 [Tolypocladium ophioglossoides CBS 100239]|uniref:Uncharacterized protein n=1 Tax=Tolypocladium ophioglossoides (strain CBS 100239) TaxID=1163406 RepID=A0A0L0NF78_TOLOC|nr:hypothetical protein TOPH_02747 [Tolypocladium ophioglossoides CBS 100239]